MKQLSMHETSTFIKPNKKSSCINDSDGMTKATLKLFPSERTTEALGQKPYKQGYCPEANVTEIIVAKDKVDSIQMLLPMLTNLNQEKRWLAWIDPPIQLLKKWQQAHKDLVTDGIMILRSSNTNSAYELSKKALGAGTCHAVIAWTKTLNQDEFSQLEIASSLGNSHGIILRSR